jgi:hypothetical protein
MLPSIFQAHMGFGSLDHNINSTTTTIFELLWNFHFSLCKDERDRLFALYGLLTRTGRSSMHPDDEHEILEPNLDPYIHCPVTYSSDYASVYTRLATAAVKSGKLQASTIIGHVFAFGSLAQQNPNWPSWVPRWNVARKTREKIVLSQSASLVYSLPSTAVPEIGIEGKMHPVTTIHNNAGPGATMAFFRYIFEPPWEFKSLFAPSQTAASMLCHAMTISGALYDRADFRFNTVFSRTSENNSKTSSLSRGVLTDWRSDDLLASHRYQSDPLMLALERLFRGSNQTHVTPDLVYSPEALDKEIDRLMKGHTLLQYEYHDGRAPGVAFVKVEYGDFIFRARDNLDSTSSSIALVLRPHVRSARERFSAPRKFRIIGYCVDYEPWDRIQGPTQSYKAIIV